jgi:hypothetical protein
VELVLVIVLTLILSAAAINGLHGVNTWRRSATINRIQADLLYARNQALLSGRRTLCVFDLGQQTYEIQQEAAPGTGALSAALVDHPLTDEPWQIAMAELAGGVRISSLPNLSQPSFGFGGDGLPIAATGTRVKSDLDVTFNTGATLTVFAGSGLSEVRWP